MLEKSERYKFENKKIKKISNRQQYTQKDENRVFISQHNMLILLFSYQSHCTFSLPHKKKYPSIEPQPV